MPTTTSRRTRRRGKASAGLAGARSSTARSPSGPFCPSCRAPRIPHAMRVGQRVVSLERLDLNGQHLRLDPRADGRRVPIKAPVAELRWVSSPIPPPPARGAADISGKERLRRHGLQVAGTAEGVTALQLYQVGGIPMSVMRDALEQARVARSYPRQEPRSSRQPQRCLRTRRASRPSRSRSTDPGRDRLRGRLIRQIVAIPALRSTSRTRTIQIGVGLGGERQEGDRLDRGPHQGRRVARSTSAG